MKKSIIVSGIQPSGRSHIGNYLGAYKNFLKLQKQYKCYFFIADYHSITESYDPKEKQEHIFEVMTDFLAVGLDPKESVLFLQSDIYEHLELAWVFNCITPLSELKRMTQFKDKALRQEKNINVGLLDYPVLQSADVLLYKAEAVPVGKDQEQHIELIRTIARLFNNRFGQTFPEPKSLFTKTPKVASLLQPDKKMSKSLGEKHCIFLNDSPETIQQKIQRAVTDTGDGKSSGAANLLTLVKEFSKAAIYKKFWKDQQEGKLQYSQLKKQLTLSIIEFFEEFRQKKAEFRKEQQKVFDIFSQGAAKAKKEAAQTIKEIRKKIGIEK